MPSDRGPGALRPPTGAPNSRLRPPGGTAAEPARASRLWVWLLLATAVAVAGAVLLLLPDVVRQREAVQQEGKQKQDAEIPEPAAPPAAAPVTPGKTAPVAGEEGSEAARAQATASLQDYLRLRAHPELAQARHWGDPEWSRAEAAVAAAEKALKARQFEEAAQRYGEAKTLLGALLESRDQRLRASIVSGSAALEQDDSEKAIRQFKLALSIEPGEPEAARGLVRAEARAEVLERMAAGRQAEEKGDLETALEAYAAAVGLDGEYAPAKEASKRAEDLVAEKKFRAAMSRALAAIRAGKLEQADAALDEARRLRPGDPALQDARSRLASRRREARLAVLRRQGERQERSEKWQAAEESYRKALAIDSNAAFARQGLERARERIRLHQQLDHYLESPGRLQSKTPYENARRLLESAQGAGAGEPGLRKKIAALQRAVEQAGAKVSLELRSDGETEVAIYRVGRLGRFRQKSVTLRPGRYTIVGSRDGCRDVRRVIEVKPDRTPPPVTIQCVERL